MAGSGKDIDMKYNLMKQPVPPSQSDNDDFSEFSNVDKYGEPGLSDMLNWIVAEEPGIWQDVGTELGVPNGVLEGFKMNLSFGGKPNLMFKEALIYWGKKQKVKPYTWQTILEALSSPIVGQHQLATKVADKLRLRR